MTSLSPVQQKFILHWGEMGTRWGINRTVAQIHALLFISPNPPSLNFVSGHRNPTRYVRVDESAPDAVRAAMEEVAGGAGNWLLLQTDFVFDVAPQARRVLAEQFSHEGDQGKFTLWRRRQGKRGEGDGEEVEP